MNRDIYKTIGASNHSETERQKDDYYATHPDVTEWLTKIVNLSDNIWECACGEGHISKVLEQKGHTVKSTDLIDRGYGTGGIDFLQQTEMFDGDIVTNPPYKYAEEFVYKALELIPEGRKVIMLLKLQFLEGKSRRKLYDKYPPKEVWVTSSRIKCGMNGNFDIGNSAMAYAWYVWEKGYKGDPIIKWFN